MISQDDLKEIKVAVVGQKIPCLAAKDKGNEDGISPHKHETETAS